MLAFEVYVNKVKVCTAGLEEFDSIIASLTCLIDPDGRPDEKKIRFQVGAVSEKRIYEWVRYEMQVNNRVEIRIVNTSKPDKPKELKCPGGSCSISES